MKKLVLCLLILLMLMPLSVYADTSEVIYKQSFESEALPDGWSVTSGKNAVASEIPSEGITAKDGNRALRSGNNAAIEKSFTNEESLLYAKISFWIYDDMSDVATAVMSLSGTDQTGIIFGLSSVTGWNNKYYSYRFANSGAGTRTSVERTLGWHKFTVDFSNSNSAVLSIDDNEIVTLEVSGVYDKITLGALWWGANKESNAYIDNLSVEKEEKIEVTKAVFKQNGEVIDDILNGDIDCSLSILNNTLTDKSGRLILAFYKESELRRISVSDTAAISAGKITTLNGSLYCEIKDDELSADCRLEAYIWNNLNELIPVVNKTQLKNKRTAPKFLPKTDPIEDTWEFDTLGVGFTSSSVFLGYQRGINRDLAFYGWQANNAVTWSGDFSSLIMLSDIDGDGYDDGILSDENKNIYWMKNNKDGTFETSQMLNLPQVPDNTNVASGDFNGDGYADFAYINEGTINIYNKNGDTYKKSPELCNDVLSAFGAVEVKNGDFDGNGYSDLIAFGEESKYLILYGDKMQRFTSYYEGTLSFAGSIIEDHGLITVADFNTDGHCDMALYNSSECPDTVLFLMGKGDGSFGIKEDEQNELWATSLYGKIPWEGINPSAFVAGYLMDKYQHPDFAVVNDGALLVRTQSTIHTAYDYSMHMMKEGDRYRMYSGGRWMTLDDNRQVIGDGDHVLLSESLDGGYSWTRYYKPMFYKGNETGNGSEWWSNNVLEPEVIKVDDTYYMFCQVQVNKGCQIPEGGTATAQCDRIVIATSKDGYNWNYEAGTTGSVIKNIDTTVVDRINIHHQEVMYVEDDVDGKPWWMYVYCTIDGGSKGFIRIRSDNPRYFDYADGEKVSGLAQLGNQMGYMENTPEGRVFIRITFSGSNPYLQMSRDGLTWYRPSNGVLAGVDTTVENASNNTNCYFLGIATENGTGKIMPEHDGTYKLVYAASTSNSASGKPIFLSECGIGMATLKFK